LRAGLLEEHAVKEDSEAKKHVRESKEEDVSTAAETDAAASAAAA